MTINFKTGHSGWGQYVINGTAQKPREKEKIKIIDGDIKLAETLAKNNKYSGEYYKILITVEGKLSDEQMMKIYEDAKKQIFHGLKDDEYYCASVLHQDTDNSHIHMMLPKQNLLTNTHLQLYMHGIDTKRIEAIQDFVAYKNGLKLLSETKQTFQKPREENFIKEREIRNQEPFEFTLKSKKSKALAEKEVYQLVQGSIKSLKNLDALKELVQSATNLKVVNSGYERKKKFHYLTLEDAEGKKTRVKGEIFSEDYFTQNKNVQMHQLDTNLKSMDSLERELEFKSIKEKLKRENEKRYQVCNKLFEKQRAKAEKLYAYSEPTQKEKEPYKQSIAQTEIKKKGNNDITPANAPRSKRKISKDREEREQPRSRTITKRAIQANEERIRAYQEIRQARGELLNRARANIKELQEEHRGTAEAIRGEYAKNCNGEQERKREFISKFREVVKKLNEIGGKIYNFIKEKVSSSKQENKQSDEETYEDFIKEVRAFMKPSSSLKMR